MTIQDIVNITDSKIINWYSNAKSEYGVIGSGKTSYCSIKKEISVVYTENGITNNWSMDFYPEYIRNGNNWVFNCWQELA